MHRDQSGGRHHHRHQGKQQYAAGGAGKDADESRNERGYGKAGEQEWTDLRREQEVHARCLSRMVAQSNSYSRGARTARTAPPITIPINQPAPSGLTSRLKLSIATPSENVQSGAAIKNT